MKEKDRPGQFHRTGDRFSRRDFARYSSAAIGGLLFGRELRTQEREPSTVCVAKNPNRKVALQSALRDMGELDLRGKDIYLKANFNSADAFPGATEPETLSTLVHYLRENNCRKIVLVERSGMDSTRAVWNKLGIPALSRRLDLKLLPLEEIPPEGWRLAPLEGSHWKKGVEVPSFLSHDLKIVQICNLKTHRFGGHYSASLKNSIGLVAKYASAGSRYNYMSELHNSPDQRLMIAEVNQLYTPFLVVMDAMKVFVDGGPEQGDLAYPETVVVSRDRLAVDAVGVSLLRLHGALGPVLKGPVFEQEQIKRGAELGLGASSLDQIRFTASDEPSRRIVLQLQTLMEKVREEKNP